MTPNFFQGAHLKKNLSRFYRAPFKSILRVQIKRVINVNISKFEVKKRSTYFKVHFKTNHPDCRLQTLMPFKKNADPYISSAHFSFSNLVGERSKFDVDNSHFFESGTLPTPNKSQNLLVAKWRAPKAKPAMV